MVVAQLAEGSLPTPEFHGSNPGIGNISNVYNCQLLSRKDENKEKEAGKGPFLKTTFFSAATVAIFFPCPVANN